MMMCAIPQPSADLVRFPQVEPVSAYPRGIRPSDRYRVLVKDAHDRSDWDSSRHRTACYEAWPDYQTDLGLPHDYTDNHVHFAQIDADSRLRFRIERAGGEDPINSCVLRPQRYSEMSTTLTKGGNWVEFEIDPFDFTRHILVEFDHPGDRTILQHGLMIFANPPSTVPEGNVLVLPPGVVSSEHPAIDDNRRLLIDAESPWDGIYIPSNTLLNARIEVRKHNFAVTGRGMLCGSEWRWPKRIDGWKESYPITEDGRVVKSLCSGAGDTVLEGILTVHPYHFNIGGGRENVNLKAFGWRYSSDGIHGVNIRGCFTRVNDDAHYSNEGIIEHNSYWGLRNGAIFQLGWGPAALAKGGGCHVRTCNVLRGEWQRDTARQNNGIFSGVLRAKGTMRDLIFEDIIVESPCFRFIGWDMSDGVRIENVVFRNVVFKEPLGVPGNAGTVTPNFLVAGSIENVVFENVTIGGRPLRSLEQLEPMRSRNLGKVIFR